MPPNKQNQASSNVTHSAFDTEWITLVGRDGQEVSVLCTYDSFASQSSISGKMVVDLQLLQEDLGQITIQAYGGVIEKKGVAAFVKIKQLGEGF